MRKSKFTESQIVFALKQAETGVAVAEVCRKLGISEATFYSWKKKYGGLGTEELRRLRQLEEENAQMKHTCRPGAIAMCDLPLRSPNHEPFVSILTKRAYKNGVAYCA